jgi:hypothetical protein
MISELEMQGLAQIAATLIACAMEDGLPRHFIVS